MIYLLFLEFVILFIVLWFGAFITFHFFYTYKGSFKKAHNSVKEKKPGKLYSIFIESPRLIARDLSEFNPNIFKDTGLILFEGEQGSGKTIAMTKYCLDLKAKYPNIKILSNYGLQIEDDTLVTWETVVGDLNGFDGMVACFDEISLWFSNRNYANFPPDFLRTIVQNRKEHRLILGTCQQSVMVDKQIRRQCTRLIKCRSFGFFTVCWVFRPIKNADGDFMQLLPLKIYAFLQTDELRNIYDTFRVVENLKSIGFKE